MKKQGIFILLSLAFLFLAACQEPEEPLELSEGEILNELHEANIGKIVFMGDYISFKDFTAKDFITNLSITNNSDLGFRMFLEKTLSYYLHQLEPDLTVRELCSKGNFQLTFYVDQKKIYEYNLQTGAGSCEYKNSQTVYGIPLVDAAEADHWGRFLWMKFMKREGGQEALSNGSHQLKIEVRPYIEHKELKVGEIIAQGEVALTMLEEDIAEEKIAIQAIPPTDQWEIANTAYNAEKIKALNKKIAQKYFKDITSIVVAKDGKLVIEEYFNGADRTTLHNTRSVGKTLASTVMGIAIEEGHIKNVDMTLNQFYKLRDFNNYSPEKEKVSLQSLLKMSSGIDGSDSNPDSPGNEENMYPTADWVKFALDLPMDAKKTIGKNWDYFTAGVVVLGDILNKSVPQGLDKYADEKLFQPLGITNYKWQYTPTKVPNTAGGFQMNALANARYGQLYLDNGNFDGRQIIPASWAEASMTKQADIPDRPNEHYGYLLWNKSYELDDKQYEAYYASGNGGNKIIIIKDLGLVIVITATAYGQPYMHLQADEIVKKYLLPAMIE